MAKKKNTNGVCFYRLRGQKNGQIGTFSIYKTNKWKHVLTYAKNYVQKASNKYDIIIVEKVKVIKKFKKSDLLALDLDSTFTKLDNNESEKDESEKNIS